MYYSFLKKYELYKTPEKDLIRLSDYLGLKTKGYSHKQRARLVYWLLTRRHANPHANTEW